MIRHKYIVTVAVLSLCATQADAFDNGAYLKIEKQATSAFDSKDYKKAASQYGKAAKEAETKSGDKVLVISSLSNQAKCERLAGNLAAAESILYRVLPLTEKRTDGLRGRTFVELAQVQVLEKKNTMAEVSYKVACKSFEECRKAGHPDKKLEGSCYTDYASFLKAQGRNAEAVQMQAKGKALASK
ncbi:MAG: hypothetical protein K2Z81_12510 [Cyanobacteria bacterium]|nr:hypothetical protein [Cyanobacteriota bacterium]